MSGIEDIVGDYFSSLFSTLNTDMEQRELNLFFLQAKVIDEMNQELDVVFSSDEVKSAIMQMHPTKAPGSDGFPLAFFQDHWGIVGKQVTQTCLAILNGEANLSALNQTVVVLIPKGRLQNFAQ